MRVGAQVDEGFVDFAGYKTWYRRVDPSRSAGPPILVLHGGPGASSEYLRSLEALAASGHSVVRYDQIGCGRSERPGDPHIWTLELFLEELIEVRQALGLDELHLLGHSWGGVLALEHALGGASGLKSLILASTPVDAALWQDEMTTLLEGLPNATKRVCERFSRSFRMPAPRARRTKSGVSPLHSTIMAPLLRLGYRFASTASSQWLAAAMARFGFLRASAYQLAQVQFMTRYFCRENPPPTDVFRAAAGWNSSACETLWGPSDFLVTGTLREWEALSRLNKLNVPTLITSGRFDEATPKQMEKLHEGIAHSTWALFEKRAHLAHLEEQDRFHSTVAHFLAEVEGRQWAYV